MSTPQCSKKNCKTATCIRLINARTMLMGNELTYPMQFSSPAWEKFSSQRVEKFADEEEFKIDGNPLPSPRIRNVELLRVDRRKSLPRPPSKNRRYWACFVVSVVLIAGIAVGTTLGVMRGRSHHTPVSADSTAQTTVTVTQTPSGSGPMQNPSETTPPQLTPTTVTQTIPTTVDPPSKAQPSSTPAISGVSPNDGFSIPHFTSK